MFLKFKVELENQLERKIKIFRSDRGGDYTTKNLEDFFRKMILYMRLLLPIRNGVA